MLALILALLGLLALPVLARAESPPEVIYHPKVSSLPQPKKVTPVEPPKSSGTAPEPTRKLNPKAEEEPEEEPGSSEKSKPAAAAGKGNGHGGTGEGPTGNTGHGGGKRVAVTQGSRPAREPSTDRSAASGGGGSSPLVPILIVVVVLAAISIGLVFYRQRRDTPGDVGPGERAPTSD